MKKIIINHVMSRNLYSSIFNDILSYFKEYTSNKFTHIHSIEPIDEADVYHYHRPHLEDRLQTRSVVTVHHDLHDSDSSLSFTNFEETYRHAKKIICLNHLQKQYLEEREFNNLVVIPHGYNSRIFSKPQKKTLKNQYTILICSRRYGRRVKGEAYFIELLRYLDNKLIKFIIVGEDRYIDVNYLEKFGFQYDLYDRLPYRIYKNLYDSSDFLLMCSFFEGGPANLPEAVASATPVICNPIGMAHDMIDNNHNGLWLTMDPINDATLINSSLANQAFAASLFENAYLESGKRAITWESSCIQNSHVYEEVFS